MARPSPTPALAALVPLLIPQPLIAAPPRTADVTVRVVAADDGETVPSTIIRKVDGVPTQYVSDSGIVRMRGIRCDTAVTFSAKPSPTEVGFLENNSPNPCRAEPGQVTIRLRSVTYSRVLRPALGPKADEVAVRLGASAARSELFAALKDGKDSQAVAAATALANQHRQAGEGELAAAYEGIAMQRGLKVLAPAAEQRSFSMIRVQPGAKTVAPTPAGQATLRQFQAGAGLPATGAWDSSTARIVAELAPSTTTGGCC